MIQLEVGGSDNGLGAIVGFSRHRNDGLRSMFGLAFLRKRPVRSSCIERRKIFRRRVVNDVRTLECWTLQHLRALRQESYRPPQREYKQNVKKCRLRESVPG